MILFTFIIYLLINLKVLLQLYVLLNIYTRTQKSVDFYNRIANGINLDIFLYFNLDFRQQCYNRTMFW